MWLKLGKNFKFLFQVGLGRWPNAGKPRKSSCIFYQKSAWRTYALEYHIWTKGTSGFPTMTGSTFCMIRRKSDFFWWVFSFPFRDKRREADIIFVHGLRGGVFYSWRQKDCAKLIDPSGPRMVQEIGRGGIWRWSDLDSYTYCWPKVAFFGNRLYYIWHFRIGCPKTSNATFGFWGLITLRSLLIGVQSVWSSMKGTIN